MSHETFEDAEAAKVDLGIVKTDDVTTHTFRIHDLIADLGHDDVADEQEMKKRLIGNTMANALLKRVKLQKIQLEINELVLKRTMTAEEKGRFLKKFREMQQELMANMSKFDDDIKLKLMVNLDLVMQDATVWLRNQASDRGEFMQKADRNLAETEVKLRKLLTQLHIEPTHQKNIGDVKAESKSHQIKNLRTQQEQLMADLVEVFDAVNQLISAQSISHSANKKANVDPTELYNQHVASQILHMAILFLATTLNKQMEMSALHINRARILAQRQYFKHRQVLEMKYAELQLCHSMALERHAQTVATLERRLKIAVEEKERLEEACRLKQSEIKQLT